MLFCLNHPRNTKFIIPNIVFTTLMLNVTNSDVYMSPFD
ncbi:hypothetical protein HMPREF1508_1277 [Shuttleworthella sp. MSX8B]|nr:hypothetical protein HMPREF1508_1277 [Shuttleworthia sp. MSX8B]